jgi:hypothetical protein
VNESLTIKMLTRGTPPPVTEVAKYLTAFVRALNATEKGMTGRPPRSRWYVTGVDLDAEGITFRITGYDKDAEVKVRAVDQNAPPLVPSLEVSP